MNFFTHFVLHPLAGVAAVAALMVPAAHGDFALQFNRNNEVNTQAQTTVVFVPPQNVSHAIAIGQNGRVVLDGVTVTAVSNSTITVQSTWGSTVFTWIIDTNSSTDLFFRGGIGSSLSSITSGDVLNVIGTLNTTQSQPTIIATSLRDLSKERGKMNPRPNTYQGTLSAITSTAVPTSLTLNIGGTNYIVNVVATTAILSKNWITTTLSSFNVGDTVRVYGPLDGSASTTIDASVVRDASR